MADPGIWEMRNQTDNLGRLAMISAKTDRSSAVVRAKVSLVSLPPHPTPNLLYILNSVQQDQEDFL